MKAIITYHEHTRENYELAYPFDEDKAVEFTARFGLGTIKRVTVEADDLKAAWLKFAEGLKLDGWELYAWDAVIKNGVVRHGINVASALKPNHKFGYDIKDVITRIAPNAQKEWFEWGGNLAAPFKERMMNDD